jgi:hypothetical protein
MGTTPDVRHERAWSRRACAVWSVVALVAGLLLGPGFVRSLRPGQGSLRDFVQEWASARNLIEGRPVYEDQETSLARYLDFHRDPANPTDRFFIHHNAHPPTSVLLALPVAWLDYRDAMLAWNLFSLAALAASLWLMNRGLGVASSPWALLPLGAFLLVCGPFQQQMYQGQLNLVLLLLLTGTWAADRAGRPHLAGTLLGAATAVKLFPGFLLLYFLLRRDWRAVAAAAVSFALLTGLTAGVLGLAAYRDYITDVLPNVAAYQSDWLNASFAGFWSRLFNPTSHQNIVIPLWTSPTLAAAGTLVCRVALVAVLVWGLWRMETSADRDLGFGLFLVAMLLVSPVAWDHYFLLLVLPVIVIWQRLRNAGLTRWLFAIIPAILSLNMGWYYQQLIPPGLNGGAAGPTQPLTVVALPFYALLALFVVGLIVSRQRVPRRATA